MEGLHLLTDLGKSKTSDYKLRSSIAVFSGVTMVTGFIGYGIGKLVKVNPWITAISAPILFYTWVALSKKNRH